jgi:hypothetical protein
MPRVAVGVRWQRQGGDAHELGSARRNVAELAEHELQVGLVVAVRARPAGREHAGHAVQRVHAQARVVGDRWQSGIGGDGARLEQRVVGEGEAGLGHIRRARERFETDEALGETGGVKDAGKFGDLPGVPRRQDHPRGARDRRVSH